MAFSSAVLDRPSDAPPFTGELPPQEGGTPRRRLPLLAGLLAASWLLPLALHPAGLDLALLPVLVLAVASLIRVGGGLVDRLFAAGLITAAGVMAFGLLFSVWPWGIHPVPTAGVLLSTVCLAGWLADRRPRLPLRLRGTDLLVAGTATGVWYYLHHAVAGKSLTERVAYIATAEDRLGHFSYFEGIRHVGGYAFLHQEQARTYMMTPAEAVYPQGSHFLLAWVDALVRSSTAPGAALDAMNRYFLYVLAAYALLCAALVWAARWIGGPRLRGWQAAAACATVASLMLAGNYSDLVGHGFDSTIIGLLFLAVALPLAVRPAMGHTEHLLTAVAGLITVTYVYNLYGVFVGLAVAAGVLVNRRRFAGRWRSTALVLLAGLGVAALPSAVSVLSDLDVAGTSNLAGPMVGADRVLLLGGGLLALLGALGRATRRTAAGQALLVLVVGAGLVIGGFGWWQLHTIGYYSYYFEKIAAAGVVIGLMSIGAVGLLLRPSPAPPRGTSRPALLRRGGEAGLSVLAVATALSLFAGVQWGVLSAWTKPAAWYTNPLVVWGHGDGHSDLAPFATTLVERDLARANGGPLIALYSDDSYQNLRSTFVAELLLRRGGEMRALYDVYTVKVSWQPTAEQYQKMLQDLKNTIAKLPAAPTVLVANKFMADRLRADLAAAKVAGTVLHGPVLGQ
ncbi:hypothetical protein ACFVVX_16330 [Kitasatospora sp. NPDC058170]|uniref:hypothetical protein n=1 Tax=Kitasatospora sp. NPDC058170 TaxID=3346364 RepID=UPI0036DA980F